MGRFYAAEQLILILLFLFMKNNLSFYTEEVYAHHLFYEIGLVKYSNYAYHQSRGLHKSHHYNKRFKIRLCWTFDVRGTLIFYLVTPCFFFRVQKFMVKEMISARHRKKYCEVIKKSVSK